MDKEKNIKDIDSEEIQSKELNELTEEDGIFETEEVEISDYLDDDDDDSEFSEVLQLTEFTDGNLVSNPASDNFIVAEYHDIKTDEIEKKHKIQAKNFVSKITKFILDFKDVQLSEAHKKYIRQVGTLQLQHLEDLLYLVDVNKQMLNNIIARVNVTQAEDYAIINSYNNLANQHLKLIKELQTTYRSIPNVLKKMRTDVMCNQELGEGSGEEVITEDYGTSQFNNSKQMLKSILAENENNKDIPKLPENEK